MQKDEAVEVNAEMAAILQSSRFSSDFKIQMLDKQSSCESASQVADIFSKVTVQRTPTSDVYT